MKQPDGVQFLGGRQFPHVKVKLYDALGGARHHRAVFVIGNYQRGFDIGLVGWVGETGSFGHGAEGRNIRLAQRPDGHRIGGAPVELRNGIVPGP